MPVTDQEFVEELDGACRMLVDQRVRILDLFLTGYVAGLAGRAEEA